MTETNSGAALVGQTLARIGAGLVLLLVVGAARLAVVAVADTADRLSHGHSLNVSRQMVTKATVPRSGRNLGPAEPVPFR